MALTKYRLGSLISEIKELNNIHNKNFYGINIDKEFMPTIAKIDDLDEEKYKIVKRNRFVFSGMQTGRDECIRLSMYDDNDLIIVSPAYITFEIKRRDLIIPEYLFMFFLSKEKDRLGWFLSDSSIRANLDWEVFCDIEIYLPDISIQQKYVNIYKSMVANQKMYEKGLDDLKLICDVYIENLRKEYKSEKIGKYITQINEKNVDNKFKKVMGLSTEKKFREPTCRVKKDELSNYKIVRPKHIVFVQTTDTWKVLAFAVNNFKQTIVVSQIYEVFESNEKKLSANYLSLWLSRKEFDRYARFHSWGSARENFSFDDMCNVNIPIPPLHIQENIANIYKVYLKRKEINDKLKEKIKEFCPVLIKGALDEGSKNV